jgi:two-component system OmpR family response regulator
MLLKHFMHNPGRAMTRAMLFEQIWGYHYDERTNVIDVQVAKLRRKLDIEGLLSAIETVRGEGYRLAA